jgi:signal transduction histidine kinase/ligand-binding sensor domain-containing protein/AraC-like DNA-binding protein
LALDPQKAVTQYKLDIWQAERGLTQQAVVSIAQSSDGYIWLGTYGGLIRFDGIRFKVFNKDNTDPLKDSVIRVLKVDRKGVLWIGTETGGLSCLKDGKFKTYSQETFPGLKEILAIFEDRQGTLWIGTLRSGLTRFKDGVFTTYTTRDGLPSNMVRAFYEDKQGRLWIATDKGLSIRNPSGTFSEYTINNKPFDKFIISMCKTHDGALWLGGEVGLYRLHNNNVTYYGIDDGLPAPIVKCLYEDSHKNLWAGTEKGGLVRIKNGKVETFSPEDSLASGYIFAIHEDREGNLWLGTLRRGLYRLRDTAATLYTTREGMTNNFVQCIVEDRKNSLLFGTRDGVIRLKNGLYHLELTTKQGLLNNSIKSIIKDREDYIWIGTEAGLNRYKDGKTESFNPRYGFTNDYIQDLLEDKQGVIWILTPNKLHRFHKGKFTVLLNIEGVTFKSFTNLYGDREGSIWLGTTGDGVYRLKEGKISSFTTNEGLAQNDVDTVYEDQNGIFYFGTRGGLSILSGGKFINLTTKNGLIDSHIRCILEDDFNHLWLTTRTGIMRIRKRDLSDFSAGKIKKITPLVFDESDGLKSQWSDNGIKTRDGKLWFATDKGAAMIDPANIKRNRLPPPVVIETVLADGEAISHNSPEMEDGEKKRMVLEPGIKRLEFQYTAPSFIKSREIAFKMKLEGYDNDWVEAGQARSTNYTGLSPGEYTFMVTARNSDGVWNDKAASFSFYLKPYFYQTLWFYLGLALFVTVLVVSLFRLRVRQLKAREKELALQVDERTRDLQERNIELEKARQNISHTKELIEAKNIQLEKQSGKLKEMDRVKSRFLTNISHEFRTPLTLIMGPLEQMIADCPNHEEKKKKKYTLMLRNAQRLLRLINQLLELSKLDSGKMKLQAAEFDIIRFVKGIVSSFHLLAEQNDLDLRFHAYLPEEIGENGDVSLFIDPRKMEDVMCNLLINAVKFTPAGGRIMVEVSYDPSAHLHVSGDMVEFVEISVSDTGPGIPDDQLAHIFDRFYQADTSHDTPKKGTGIGLSLVKELVEIHHGTVMAGNREGGGTTFTIRLPRGDRHLNDVEIVDAAALEPDIQAEEIRLERETIALMESELENETETDGKEEETPNLFDTDPNTKEKDIILVVEDSAEVRDYIRGSLEPQYTIIEAENGKVGIEKAMSIIPDLIISDVMMPETDGYELCRVLKNDVATSHIPIILLTARASEDSIVEGLETGADDYITKPFSTFILTARIKNLIELRRHLQLTINREMTHKPVNIEVSSIDTEFIKDLKAVIDKNIADPDFNVEELSKKLYMGRSTLYRKIQALSGESPTDFIRSYRLKRGAELLKTTSMTILEVALETGFSSANYFTRCFKQKFHCVPSDYQSDRA